jgi:hypothetical protein
MKSENVPKPDFFIGHAISPKEISSRCPPAKPEKKRP